MSELGVEVSCSWRVNSCDVLGMKLALFSA